MGMLVDALEATTRKSVAAIQIGAAAMPATVAPETFVDSADTLCSCVDRLLHEHDHVLLTADGATVDERFLRAALGRSDLTVDHPT